MSEQWITLKQVAERTTMSVATIRRAVRAGRLRVVKVSHGRVWRFRETSVDEWMGLTTRSPQSAVQKPEVDRG